MPNKETQQRTLDQFMSLFVLPEIRKRQQAGIFKKPFNLIAAQVIFKKDEKPKVLINREVKMRVTAKVKNGTQMKKGALVNVDQIKNIEKMQFLAESGNEAHFSSLRIKKQWYFTFDFRYNKKRATEIIKVATEFFESAKNDFRQKRWRPFTENLFLVVELLVKAELILLPHHKDSKTHRYWKSEYNRWFSWGNTKFQYKNLFNELSNIRDKARYSESKFAINSNKAKKFIQVAESMLKRLDKYISA